MKKLQRRQFRQSRDGTTIALDRFGDSAPLILVLGALADRSAARTVAELPDARHRSLEGQTHGVADDVLAPVLVQFFSPSTPTRPR